jgi:eukaryotic-like serine/threonine-protein kinase
VVALNLATGASKWSYTTGGEVVAAPVIFSNLVYVGAENGYEYALNQASGTLAWKFNGKSAIEDSATIAYDKSATPYGLVFGTNAGKVFVLHGNTGTQLFNLSEGAPIAGVASVHGVIFMTTTTGVVAGARAYLAENETAWKYNGNAVTTAAPVVLNGAVYLALGNGDLDVFDPYGLPPV